MIFCSKNERGELAAELVFQGRKTVTRRIKPLPTGKEFVNQPGRGKKALCRCVVLSCVSDKEWCNKYIPKEAEAEAHREGFETWEGLWAWIKGKYKIVPELWRIEFKKVIA